MIKSHYPSAILPFEFVSFMQRVEGRSLQLRLSEVLNPPERMASVLQGHGESLSDRRALKETENRHFVLLSGTFF